MQKELKVFMLPQVSKKIRIKMEEYEDLKTMREVLDKELKDFLGSKFGLILSVLQGEKSFCIMTVDKNKVDVSGMINGNDVNVKFVLIDDIRKEMLQALTELQNKQSMLINMLHKL